MRGLLEYCEQQVEYVSLYDWGTESLTRRRDAKDLIAIDPGTTQSAWAVYRPEGMQVLACGIDENARVCGWIRVQGYVPAVCEMIACYGMAVGFEVYETCIWIGRFQEAYGTYGPEKGAGFHRMFRRTVKLHLCNSARATDANVRQAIIDRYLLAGLANGGGKKPYTGTKKEPGPLYHVKKDIWAALGVAITYAELGKGACLAE